MEVLIYLAKSKTGNLNDSSYQLAIDEYVLNEEDAVITSQQIEVKEAKYSNEHILLLLCKHESVSKNGLTVEQNEILQSRRKLVHYLQILHLYEKILGGAETALQKYSSEEFLQIRNQSLLKTTVEVAQSCDWKAVDSMLMHVKELDQSRLLILSNFPESIKVNEYCELLPSMGRD